MINKSPFLLDGFLDVQGLDAKINAAFNNFQPYVNGLLDTRIGKILLGNKLKTDEIGDLRHLLFFLIIADAERVKDREINLVEDWEPNSYYIELLQTEKLRDYYLCKLDNNIVNYLFSIFGFDYKDPETMKQYGIGNIIIQGDNTPFKITNYEEKIMVL